LQNFNGLTTIIWLRSVPICPAPLPADRTRRRWADLLDFKLVSLFNDIIMKLHLPTPEQQSWTKARNIIIYDELAKTLKQLNSPACRSLGAGRSNIKTIVLAGAALAQTVYPDISLRPMSDIDLLVKGSDLALIEESLSALGYKLEMRRSSEVHYQTNHPDFTIHIDIHTELPYLDNKGNDEVWSRIVKTTLSGVETHVLSPEDALIYAITDAFTGHGRINETVLNDIAAIINRLNVNWLLAIELIKCYGLQAPMYYCLNLAREKMDVEIPYEVLTKIKPPARKSIESKIYQMVLNHPSEDMAPVLRFLTCPGKLQLLHVSFFPSTDFMQRRYDVNNGISLLYYPLRILTHFWRILKLAVRML
jgi:hypothetical protein